MEASKKGYAWAVSAGLCAASAAVSAKLITNQIVKYCFVVLFNVTMWGCFVQSLKNLSSLQATATNFATNFLTSGLAGYFLFQEPLSEKAVSMDISVTKKQHFRCVKTRPLFS
ncbi:unnamed protein product [Malus baccata var. baccata]